MKNDGNDSRSARKGSGEPRTILELMTDGQPIDQAMHRAVREALLHHKKLGNPIAAERDGKVVEIPPDEIPV